MKILMLGDVVGQNGCSFVTKQLPGLRRRYGVQLTVANGENSAEGNGILPASAQQLFDAGVDVITLGNHALRRREVYNLLDECDTLLRPANFHPTAPGKGVCVYDCPGRPRVAVISLTGSCYMDFCYANPFETADRLLCQLDAPIVLVDFHAEATSEKLCMGFYLDGRVSAVVGTHTHIQTADERILPGGTGYLTDLGMCGSFHSVLGVKPQLAMARFLTALPTRFENDPGPCRLSGVLLDIDDATGKTNEIIRINAE
ncbi:MAG: TIGR00282 family metallophosphoesterase [Angelakisella sp.]